jgi:hypothetical protein
VTARSGDAALVGPIAVSVMFTFLSLPSSVLGNEAALRFGRHRAIAWVMFASAALSLVLRHDRRHHDMRQETADLGNAHGDDEDASAQPMRSSFGRRTGYFYPH